MNVLFNVKCHCWSLDLSLTNQPIHAADSVQYHFIWWAILLANTRVYLYDCILSVRFKNTRDKRDLVLFATLQIEKLENYLDNRYWNKLKNRNMKNSFRWNNRFVAEPSGAKSWIFHIHIEKIPKDSKLLYHIVLAFFYFHTPIHPLAYHQLLVILRIAEFKKLLVLSSIRLRNTNHSRNFRVKRKKSITLQLTHRK